MMLVPRKSKLIIVFVLVLLLVDLGPIFGQASKSFTGKIAEIARGAELGVAMHGTFYVLRLEEYPNVQFRLSAEDAVRYGLIEKAGPTGIVTPKMSKGIGWKVKLTCDSNYEGDRKTPTYKVRSLVKLADRG
ncbi:MAG: hypothetical protein M1438_05625 [Deltaproteobacteria bacterium]|nr:hypothetical protein [Deltaproteobacteria bacterium]